MEFKLFTQKYPQEGDLQHTYSPLKNKIRKDDNAIDDLNTDEISVSLNHPLNIECQPSYDGTVNLIINDDVNPPRIINSRFTKIEDNRFRIINRNQTEQTNLYKEGLIDLQSRLFRNITKIPRFNFVELNYFGQLKGGNYTFYLKLADSDYNKTDVVCESGQISIMKGNLIKIPSISGTLQDERTDKSIRLELTNLDESFSKFYLYYTREYSDLNGFRMSETVSILDPYEITGETQEVIINGFEEISEVDSSELNIQYNYVTNVKTQAQVQNRLFFGNIENVNVDIKNLQNISYFFEVSLQQKSESVGWINPDTYQPTEDYLLEYYDPKNVYYNLGYWPDEIYRLGVVYIMKDDSLSPVFSLRGCEFEDLNHSNVENSKITYKVQDSTGKYNINYLERDAFLTSEKDLTNTFGVFKNPAQTSNNAVHNPTKKTNRPWYYKISIPKFTFGGEDCDLVDELKNLGVKGFFFVRQKRIPTVLCQGVSVGIDGASYTPMLYNKINKNWFSESFLHQSNGKLTYSFEQRKVTSTNKNGSALLSVDAIVTSTLQSNLDGSTFILQKLSDSGSFSQSGRTFSLHTNTVENLYRTAPCVYMSEDVPFKYINGYGFSTRAGSDVTVKEFGFFADDSETAKEDKNNYKLVRGVYSPFIAVCSNIEDNALYNIRISNYSTQYMKDYFGIRRDDNAPFYAISDRYELNDLNRTQSVYRGDCFTNTVTIRLNRNFTDPDYPINDTIIDSETWINHYNGYYGTKANDKDEGPDGNWAMINRGDLNAVPMGMWVSYKCLSNYNLGLRAEDRSYVDEMALMGNPRTFYPLHDTSVRSANKVSESKILNNGYSATVGQKVNVAAPNVPYIKDQFDNRIMFSQTQVDGDFRNAYRIFQGLSYKDIDRQYGAIVKLIPWGVNLLSVFEHGLGVVPINEKALIQTNTEQSIHMYGAGVLQNQITLITPDFGSIWPESILRTPIGVYGVDTYAKKIWRYTDNKGFETISDMKIQRFLNDNIKLKEEDKYPTIALRNVKTHYNNYKGDVIFTFYNFTEGEEWSFCFNERLDKWITRYSWTPLYSENINNIFYSLDKRRAEVLSYIYDNRNTSYGLRTTENEWKYDESTGDLTDKFSTELYLTGNSLITHFNVTVNSVTSSYLKDGNEVDINLSTSIFQIKEGSDNKLILEWNKSDLEYRYGVRIPLYYKINVTVQPYINGSRATSYNETICIVVDHRYDEDKYSDLLGNGFYVHGRAGIFNEIDYYDDNPDNQIKPTYWYNKQEPFEFEFVVNEPVGLHKIFDNLVIISNKAQPKSIEFEVIGDVYNFKKSGLFKSKKGFKNTTVDYDPILNQYTLITEQECKNIEDPKYGRRLGNIHYKEDSWYLTIEPIKFDPKFEADKDDTGVKWSSARIRDKFAKIRVKYSGNQQVIITAIKNLYSLSSS